MVDFRQIPQLRNYFSRREQWRLLLLLLSLGLVALLMSRARDPKNWAWFVALDNAADPPASTSVPADRVRGDKPLGAKLPEEEMRDAPAPPETPRQAVDGFFPGVNPEYLDAVRDDATFRDEEQDAWFHLLAILRDTDEAELRRASTARVTYGQLFRQSQQYRGQLVTVRGTIRRTSLPRVGENDYRIDRYYQTIVQPKDSPRELMFVYCLYLPKGFPEGMDVSADVEVTGFYFKRWAYPAQNVVRTAPVLVARTVDWQKPPPAVNQPRVGVSVVLMWVGVGLIASLFLVVYVYLRTRRGRSREPAAPPRFDGLGDVEPASAPRLPWEAARRGEERND